MVVVERPESPDPEWHKEPTVDGAPEHTWFNEMVNAEKNQRTFDDVMGSIIDFTNFSKNCLKKDKIMKADLEGLTFKLMKGKHKNYIELKFPHDLSKPLPLHGAPGRLTILVDFFFNKDLEYITTRNVENKYATSFTKPKATRYDLESIEEMIPKLWGSSKEIFVRRANKKEYTFKEVDFPRLHLNDIKYMCLLYAQNKLHHLIGDEQTNLVTALRFFIRIIIIQKRVEDVQLGVKIYQTKLNITMPQVRCAGLDDKEPYTTFYEPRGVVYLNKDNNKFLMRADELYKFRDGTLKKAILPEMILAFDWDDRSLIAATWILYELTLC
nr:hypothetical protein [Tanacetum cinerariifolium]